METTLQNHVSRIVQRGPVQSVLLLQSIDKYSAFLDGANFLFLVVVNRPTPAWESKSYMFKGSRLVEHYVSQWVVERWTVQGTPEKIIHWLSQAEIMFDKEDYIKRMLDLLIPLPKQVQKKKVCEEYARFLRRYLEAKELLRLDQVLDAYQSVSNALYHWARLVIYEAGEQPGELLWQQVRAIEPSVCKLYEELICGQEPLAKRIELQLLPIEFSVMSKMKACTAFVTEILQSRARPWSLEELQQHPRLTNTAIDLPLLLEKMAARSIIQEVVLHNHDANVMTRGYILAG
ncbi:nucleotidyltransferase-like protein [Brevibacillus humidisoli]|uniref:nucleotidyltransferase-like protein n=1 Tax=Brevibacillus humidisoli TaxID=2895522 RepID=UPI001E618049|nr:nucleotidyltransferase-like protein [Brevibacillus humidisoli]UFJ41300.1 nucleotidyltransferase-like protein [Brevibacillus humidisoli]